MRFKIIAANAIIVLIVGVVAFFLVRMTLAATGTKADQLAIEAKQDGQGAAARLQLDAISAEQWLAVKAAESATVNVLAKGGAGGAGDEATRVCTQIQTDSQSVDSLRGNPPTFAALLDLQGRIIGRSTTTAQRGDDYGARYPALKTTTLATGQPGADIWLQTGDNYLASYVPVRDATGKIAGALVIGRPLSDALSHVSDLTTGRPLELVMQSGDTSVTVSSTKTDARTDSAVKGSGAVSVSVKKVLRDGHGSDVASEADLVVATTALDSLASGSRAVLVSPGAGVGEEPNFIGPVFAAIAIGLAMVILAGWLLGNYITRPIATIEEGLLAILNGQADKRFELDHAELGGLAFRIDQLLNQLMGVEEDTTDAEGRPSKAPSAAHFSDAMSVEGTPAPRTGGIDPGVVAQLAAEPAAAYYARIYREYIAAKQGLGEETKHISEQAFATRIQGMEQEYSEKYKKSARYQVQANAKEVVLLAIPLS